MSDRTGRRLPAAGALALAAVLLAACSSAATSAPTAQVLPATAAPAASAAPASTEAATGDAYTVNVATDATLGKFLTGEDGKTLYVFKKDAASTSNCTGGCAQAWPPFELEGSETVAAGDGVGGSLTTFARADGSMQVAYNGAPLYYYATDQKAGDVTGQGVGGVWFVAQP